MVSKERCWTEIDLSALKENYVLLKNRIPTDCRLMSIVKADGYGHGAIAVAKALADDREGWLGVACLEEALTLRQANIQKPILILGYTAPQYAEILAKERITQAMISPDYAAALAAVARVASVRVSVHVAVDTGMSRIGYLVNEETFLEAVSKIAELYCDPVFHVTGIFTHFSSAYEQTQDAKDYTALQFQRFTRICAALKQKGIEPGLRHCSNSPATVNCPEYALDMCRVGTVLYGLLPPTAMTVELPFKPVLSWKAKVAMLKTLPQDTPVSYSRTAYTQRETRLAVVTAGDADGYFRQLTNLGQVSIRGHICPVVGRVCMDMFMVDVTDHSDIRPGDDVLLLGGTGEGSIPCSLLYKPIGIGPSAVTCNIRSRVSRFFIND